MSDVVITKHKTKKISSSKKISHAIRVVTATSLFDGHDASINIMRQVLQSHGAEVIHLGHNRSVNEIVKAAIEEDVHAIAISSYQGGHMEFFGYLIEKLREYGAQHIQIFGGGGGVITPNEIKKLHSMGINRIFSPQDGQKMKLDGMIEYILQQCRVHQARDKKDPNISSVYALSQAISHIENFSLNSNLSDILKLNGWREKIVNNDKNIPVIGFTGTGGAGKSSLIDEVILRFLSEYDKLKIALLCIDPTRKRTGGSLLGDRLRINTAGNNRVYMRSIATKNANNDHAYHSLPNIIELFKKTGYDLIIVETSGIGQQDCSIVDYVDIPIYVMTNEFGAPSQLEKINMLDYADYVVLNKYEKQGSKDALRVLSKQYRRNHKFFDKPLYEMPIYPTIASRFCDQGVTSFFWSIMKDIHKRYNTFIRVGDEHNSKPIIDLSTDVFIPYNRIRYMSEIADSIAQYYTWVDTQVKLFKRLENIRNTISILQQDDKKTNADVIDNLCQYEKKICGDIDKETHQLYTVWQNDLNQYGQDTITNNSVKISLYRSTISGTKINRIALPHGESSYKQLEYVLKENVPGRFPFTGGTFRFKRTSERPTRMFAGEGTPERTNRRFHYITQGNINHRLSTAFDSVSLYGENPDEVPDIWGKIGNSGVSVCNLDDMKKLFSGFDLVDPKTSVSMTINGPAPMILAMFFNVAIDQEVEKTLRNEGQWEMIKKDIQSYFSNKNCSQPIYQGDLPDGHNGLGLGFLGVASRNIIGEARYHKIKHEVLKKLRGTIQADILKEDIAQNTCIFSVPFALRMMGDVQDYFCKNHVRYFYSVSISGYHIAEAGANPITQTAFTLANGFTYVEYFLSRGMKIDDFAHNLSFFFSNGLDPEYAVIGRVARRIWAIAMKYRYRANHRSQKLKYHIQTSGRSLHDQEIQYNDIRTTLQALMALYDNCNSLHTNAYDEAITTPTEESVRRAMAIQMIINEEYGMMKNENVLQGSYFIQELTSLVEEAILLEFRRICERGGVLTAMEFGYQRGKIQDESHEYEMAKLKGSIPIIGVNTFTNKNKNHQISESNLIRSTEKEKKQQLDYLHFFHHLNKEKAKDEIHNLYQVIQNEGNFFDVFIQAVESLSLGQITHELYKIGGRYRRTT